jgi:CDP-diacylglycerol--serine O-phosphatidyltransferase
VLSIALLIAYPWVLLTAGTLAYLVSLPFGYLSYRAHARRSRETRVDVAPAATATSGPTTAHVPPPAGAGAADDRPSRLN